MCEDALITMEDITMDKSSNQKRGNGRQGNANKSGSGKSGSNASNYKQNQQDSSSNFNPKDHPRDEEGRFTDK